MNSTDEVSSALSRAHQARAAQGQQHHPMRAPYTTNQPHLNGVVAVSIDGQIKCAAVLITAHDSALSVASCFLLPRTLPLSEAQQIACLQGACEPNTVVSPSSVRLLGGNDARVREVAARVHRIAIRFTLTWAIPICTMLSAVKDGTSRCSRLIRAAHAGPLACLPPIPLSSVPAAIGLTPTAVVALRTIRALVNARMGLEAGDEWKRRTTCGARTRVARGEPAANVGGSNGRRRAGRCGRRSGGLAPWPVLRRRHGCGAFV